MGTVLRLGLGFIIGVRMGIQIELGIGIGTDLNWDSELAVEIGILIGCGMELGTLASGQLGFVCFGIRPKLQQLSERHCT